MHAEYWCVTQNCVVCVDIGVTTQKLCALDICDTKVVHTGYGCTVHALHFGHACCTCRTCAC
jgi:hypothetical protein